MKKLILLTMLFIGLTISNAASLLADDWPQWMGPSRDNVWTETDIISEIPDTGLKAKWRTKVGLGYSGPAIANGKVYITDYVKSTGDIANSPDGRIALTGVERVTCFDAETGDRIWQDSYEQDYKISYPSGPRCTPTVAGKHVYTLGAEGNLRCLTADKGEEEWERDFTKEYGAKTPIWGYSSHPLVDGDLLYSLVGGEGQLVIAFNRHTGEEVWRALSGENPGYCPPTMIEHAGVKQLLIWHPKALNSLNPKTGEVYWTISIEPQYEMSICAPQKQGNQLYVSGIGSTAAVIKLDDEKPGAEIVWKAQPKQAVFCANSTPMIFKDTIYGSDCQVGQLIAAKLSDGERLWETFAATTGGKRRASHGTAFIVRNGDRFYLFNEKGDLVIARLTPEEYEEVGRYHLLDPTNECFGRPVVWSAPAFAEKCVFVRNDKELVCVSLAKTDTR